jgi:hypothetical protein
MAFSKDANNNNTAEVDATINDEIQDVTPNTVTKNVAQKQPGSTFQFHPNKGDLLEAKRRKQTYLRLTRTSGWPSKIQKQLLNIRK